MLELTDQLFGRCRHSRRDCSRPSGPAVHVPEPLAHAWLRSLRSLTPAVRLGQGGASGSAAFAPRSGSGPGVALRRGGGCWPATRA
jgi:hypothetical protein